MHKRLAMRFVTVCVALLLGPLSAHAQDDLGVGVGPGAETTVCVGPNAPDATFSIVVRQSDGTFLQIARTVTGSVIDAADCNCDAQDLFLQAFVNAGLPNGSQPTFSVWEGAGCDMPTARTSTCEQVTATVMPSDFWNGSANRTPRQLIQVRSLISPDPAASPGHPTVHTCPTTSVTNSSFFLFGPLNAPSFCAVPLPASTILPTPPQNVSVLPGDGAVTVRWQAPAVGSSVVPVSYQVLCADQNGNPLPNQGAYALGDPINQPHQLGYSTCIDATNHVIERRVLATTGTNVGTTTAAPVPDGRVGATTAQPSGFVPGGAPAAAVSTDAITTFNQLEKRFVCSDIIQAVGIDYSVRIGGLINGQNYSFAVVGIDLSGNPAPTAVATVAAVPVENLYARFLDQGGQPQGFCFIATAAYGSSENPYVKLLRRFRDRALIPHASGRAFVAWYYRVSPPAAAYISVRPSLRWVVRQLLWPLIVFAALWLWSPITLLAVVFLGLLYLLARRRLRPVLRAIPQQVRRFAEYVERSWI